MLNIILGKAGTGKTEYLINMINKINNIEDILVIIPDQKSFEYDKKLYNKLGASVYNKIEIYTFSKLAQIIIDKFGLSEGTYADDITKLALMNSALKEVHDNESFLFYDKQYGKGSFIKQSVDIIKEMHWSDITEENLADKSDNSNLGVLSDKLSDICSISVHYKSKIKKSGHKDDLNNLNEAAGLAESNDYFKNKFVFIDGFYSFSADEYNVVKSAILSSEETYIALTLDDVSVHDTDIFNISLNTYNKLTYTAEANNIGLNIVKQKKFYRFKNQELCFLSDNIFRISDKKIHSNGNVHLIEAEDIYKEAEYTAAEIRRLVIENGIRYKDVAVIASSLSDYQSIIESTFERYSISFFLDNNSDILHKTLVLFITSLFDILIQKKPETETILRFIKTGFLKIKKNNAFRYISIDEISMLENFCYQWNVNGYMWLNDFPEDNEISKKCNILRRSIIEPIYNLKKSISSDFSFKNICIKITDYFDNIFLKQTVNDLFKSENRTDSEEITIARETRQLWNYIMIVFDTIYNTTGIEKTSLKEFKELFLLLLSECKILNPPQSIDSVIVSEISRCSLNEPKILFILGANEGKFPAAVKNSGLISEREKEILKKINVIFTETLERQITDERFKAYNTISSPTEMLYISCCRTGISGEKGHPSYLFTQISDMYEDNIVSRTGDYDISFYSSTSQAAYYCFIQDFNKKNIETNTLYKFLSEKEQYSDKIDYFNNLTFNKKHEIKNKDIIYGLFGDKLTVSASRFEDFNKCHFSYFCKKGLKLYPLRKIDIDPIEQGNIIHKCLHDILSENTKEKFISASKNELFSSVSKKLDTYYNENLGGSFGKTHRFISLFSSYCNTITEILIHIQNELKQSGFVPSEFELKIPTDNIADPIRLISDNGAEIRFVGTIDRVDVYNDGSKQYIRVIDYKSGEKKFSLEDLVYGINMQMLLYLFTLTQSNTKYSRHIPSGVLYMPSKEAEVSLGRDPEEQEIQNAKNKTFKMNGILLNDEKVLKAMEENIAGIYIPVKKTSNGFDKYSMLINSTQLENLRDYSYGLLKKMADTLYSGGISANPLIISGRSPCDYCDYKEICGEIPRSDIRNFNNDTAKEINNIMNGGTVKNE